MRWNQLDYGWADDVIQSCPTKMAINAINVDRFKLKSITFTCRFGRNSGPMPLSGCDGDSCDRIEFLAILSSVKDCSQWAVLFHVWNTSSTVDLCRANDARPRPLPADCGRCRHIGNLCSRVFFLLFSLQILFLLNFFFFFVNFIFCKKKFFAIFFANFVFTELFLQLLFQFYFLQVFKIFLQIFSIFFIFTKTFFCNF